MIKLIAIIFLLIFIGGCYDATISYKQEAISKCIELCKNKTEDLNNGPCLGLAADNWVCDVAHSPREAIDNLPENQCTDYREGKVKHFVEVTPECNFIRGG